MDDKTTEQRIAELEAALRVIEASPAVVFRWRAAEGWPVEYVSQNIRQFGYTPEDFLTGRVPYSSIVHPEDLERVGSEVAQNSESGVESFQQEYRILTSDGQVRWTDDRTVVVRDAQGQITHYQGIILDVTDHKQAEKAASDRIRTLNFLGELGHKLDENPTVPDTLSWVAEHLPGAAQFSEISMAAVEYEGQLYGQPEAAQTPYKMVGGLRLEGELKGWLYLAYREERPFIDEESALMGVVTGRLGNYLERQHSTAQAESDRAVLRQVVDNIPAGVFMIEAPTGRPLIFNDRAIEAIGPGLVSGNREDTYPAFIFDTDVLYPPERHPLVRAMMGETSTVDDMQVNRPDGTRLVLEVNGTPVRNSQGDIVAAIAIFTDIRKRREEETEIRMLAAVAQQSVDGLAVANQDGFLQFVNPAWAQMHGYAVEELLGKHLSMFHTPDQLMQEVMPFNERALKVGVAQEEIGHVRKDGSTFPTWMTVGKILDENGKETGLVASAQDITNRKLAEKRVQDSEAYSKRLFSTSPVGLMVIEMPSLQFSDVNPKAVSLCGFTEPEELVGQTPLYVSAPAQYDGTPTMEAAQRNIQLAVEQGGYSFDWLCQRPTGELWDGEVHLMPFEMGGQLYIQLSVSDVTESKRSAEALRQSRAQLSEGSRVAKLGYWEFDLATQKFNFTDEYYAVLGTSAQKEGGYLMSVEAFVEKFVYPEDAGVIGPGIQRAIETNDPNFNEMIEARAIRADGTVIWQQVSIRISKDAEGRTVKIIGANQDITERKLAEEKVRQSQAILAEASRMAHLGSWELDLSTKMVTFTDEYYALLGTSAEAEGGYQMPMEDFVARFGHQGDGPRVLQTLQNVAASGSPEVVAEVEGRIIRTDGVERYLLTQMRAEFDPQGMPLKVLGANQDITERKLAEEKVRQSQEILAEASRMAKLGHWEMDLATGMMTCTDEYFQLLGTTAEAEGGYLMPMDVFPQRFGNPEDFSQAMVALNSLLSSDDPSKIAQMEGRVRRVDGEERYVITQMRLLRDPQGRPIKVLCAGQDITERKLAELKLLESQSQLSEAMQIANLAYWEFDVATGMFTFNDQWFRLMHTTPEREGGYQLSAQVFTERFVPQEDWGDTGARIGMALQATDPDFMMEATSRLLFGDGTEGYILLRIRVLKDAQGQTIKLYGTNQDVTQRVLAEKLIARRAQELETVAQVSTQVSSTLDTHQVLQNLVDMSKESFDLYHAHIYLLDEAGELLILAAGAGEVGAQMVSQGWQIPLDRQQSLVARAARTHEGFIVNDVRTEPGFLPNPLLPETRSELAVPLLFGERVVGVFDVQSDRVGYFTDEDIRIHMTLAGQIAVALQNAHQFAETNELYQANAELSLVTTHDQILDVLRRYTLLGQDVQNVSVNYFDRPWTSEQLPQWIHVLTRWSQLEQDPGQPRYALSDFPSLPTLLRPDELTLVEDLQSVSLGEDMRALFADVYQARALLFVPLTVGGEWVGLINAIYTQPMHFPEAEIRRLMALTRQAAVAMQNLVSLDLMTQAFLQAQASKEESEKLYQASRRLVSASNLQEMVAAVVEGLNVSDINRAVLELTEYDDAGEPIALDVVANWYSGQGTPPVPVGARFSRQVFSTLKFMLGKEPQFFSDIQHDPRMDAVSVQMLKEAAAASVAMLPLWVGNHQLGALLLESEVLHEFTEDEIRTYPALVSQLAIAVENRRLLEETQARARRERLLREVTSRVRGTVDADTILRTAVQELGTALGRQVFVRLGQPVLETAGAPAENGSNGGSLPQDQQSAAAEGDK